MHKNTACPVAQVDPNKDVWVARANLNAVCLLSHEDLNAFRFWQMVYTSKKNFLLLETFDFLYFSRLILGNEQVIAGVDAQVQWYL